MARAGEAPTAPAPILDYLGTAMAAYVQEGMELSVVVSSHQDRDARFAGSKIAAVLGQVRTEAQWQWSVAEKHFLLALQKIRAGVVADRRAGHAASVRAGVVGNALL